MATVLLGAAAVGALTYRPAARVAAASAPTIWACGESVKVRPETPPVERSVTWDGVGRQVTLYGARQEYVGFQVVLRAGDMPLDGVEVQVPALRSSAGAELGPENVDLFQEHYLKVTVPSQFGNTEPVPEAAAGEFPVQMVPLRSPLPGTRFSVPAGRNQPVWVDLYVPENQAPGDYTGEVRVLANGQPLETLKVRLTVWSFALPQETHLKTLVPTGPEKIRWGFGLRREQTAELAALEDRFFQMAHQHRLNFHPSAGDDPEEEWGQRYRRYLDGSAFKERAGAGVGQNLLVVEIPDDEPQALARYARKVVDWWKRSGHKAALACYVYDEPHEDEEFATVAARARAIRGAVGRELPLFLTTVKPGKVPPGLIDIWGEAPASEIPARQAAGERFWATNQGYAGGPYVDTSGYAGRSQAWMAWRLKLDGWQFWDCCYWLDKQNLFDAQGKKLTAAAIESNAAQLLTDTWNNPLTFDQKKNPREKDWIRLNGDGVLFYPGKPAGLQEPLASFTMKSLRRGLQDYEYLWLLQQKSRPADDVVARIVPGPGQWAKDPEVWDSARIELGKRLAAP